VPADKRIHQRGDILGDASSVLCTVGEVPERCLGVRAPVPGVLESVDQSPLFQRQEQLSRRIVELLQERDRLEHVINDLWELAPSQPTVTLVKI